MTPQERFEVLKMFRGCGNPQTARIVFIGIEEHDDWNHSSEELLSFFPKEEVGNDPERALDRLVNLHADGFLPRTMWHLINPRWQEEPPNPQTLDGIQNRLGRRIRQEAWGQKGLPESDNDYRRDEFGNVEFQANVWPLGKSSAGEQGWEEVRTRYHEIFGVPLDCSQYKKDCIESRLKTLRILMDQVKRANEPYVVIVMGKNDIWLNQGLWPSLNDKVLCTDLPNPAHDERIVWSSDYTVCLTVQRSGAHGLQDVEVDSIVNTLKTHRR